MPKLTRQQQEEAVLALANKPNNSPHVRNFKPPADRKELIDSLPNTFMDIRRHGNDTLKRYGRPPAFTVEELEQQLDDLLEFACERKIPLSMSLVASWLGVCGDTLRAWASDQTSPFSVLIKRIKEDISTQRIQNGELNATNPIFSMFILKAQHDFIETSNVNISATANIPAQTNPEQVAAEAERQVQRMLSDGTLRV